MDKGIQQNIGSPQPNFPGFSYPQPPEGQMLPLNDNLNHNLNHFASNDDYGLVEGNVGNQNEVEQEFTFPIQPNTNEFLQNDDMFSFVPPSGVSYDQTVVEAPDSLTTFVSNSEPLSQWSDLSNSFTSATQSSSLDSDMYQDDYFVTAQSLSQGAEFPDFQDNGLTNFTSVQPESQEPNPFPQQSNISTDFTSDPQSLNQGFDTSYQNPFTNFSSTNPESFHQESDFASNIPPSFNEESDFTFNVPQSFDQEPFDLSYYQNILFENSNPTPQSWSHQDPNPQDHQSNVLNNNFPSLPPPLIQEYDSSYHPQPLGQAPNLPYHQGNSSTNFTFTPPQSSNQGTSLPHLNQDHPSTNFTFTPRQLNQWPPSLPQNHVNPSTNFTFNIRQPLGQGSSLPPLHNNPPPNNFTFTPQQLTQRSSLPSPTNFPFNDYSLNYPTAQRGQQSYNGEPRATFVPLPYNPTLFQQNPNTQAFNNVVQQNPYGQGFNLPQPSTVLPQNINYNMWKNIMGAPSNTAAVTTPPPQPPRVDIVAAMRNGGYRSAASLLAANSQMFGQGLLGHYQALGNTIARGFGRGAVPYPGLTRHEWRTSVVEEVVLAGTSPADRERWKAAMASMQHAMTAEDEAMMEELDLALQAGIAADLGLQRERWTFRVPTTVAGAAAGANQAARAGAGAGRGRGGGRRGRRRRETGVSINEGRNAAAATETGGVYTVLLPEGGEGDGQGKGKEKVGEEAVQVPSRKGKEKVVEEEPPVQSRKGKEKVGEPSVFVGEDDDTDEDVALDLENLFDWQDYFNSPSPPPPPPPANY